MIRHFFALDGMDAVVTNALGKKIARTQFFYRGSVRSQNCHFLLLSNFVYVIKSRLFVYLFTQLIGAHGGRSTGQGVKPCR
jgi:hypothetical protein